MIFANESSDALAKANPYFEIGIAVLALAGGGLMALDIFLQNRKSGASWTRDQVVKCIAVIGFGLGMLVFYFLE